MAYSVSEYAYVREYVWVSEWVSEWESVGMRACINLPWFIVMGYGWVPLGIPLSIYWEIEYIFNELRWGMVNPD